METRRSRSPPPSFPNETKREILSFCDTPSLANASLVSLAFLELVSPFLYHHIAIQGLEQLSRLFHEEKRTSSSSTAPHLDHFLSLSRIRTFTFVGVPKDVNWTTIIPSNRLPASLPLPIETLDVVFDRVQATLLPTKSAVLPSLLRLFNPRHARFDAPRTSKNSRTWMLLEDPPWTRLESLALRGLVVNGKYLAESSFVHRSSQGLVISFDLSEHHISSTYIEESYLEELVADGGSADNESLVGCRGVKEVVLRVGSQDQVDRVLERLREKWDEEDADEEMQKRMEEKIRFEMVGGSEEIGGE